MFKIIIIFLMKIYFSCSIMITHAEPMGYFLSVKVRIFVNFGEVMNHIFGEVINHVYTRAPMPLQCMCVYTLSHSLCQRSAACLWKLLVACIMHMHSLRHWLGNQLSKHRYLPTPLHCHVEWSTIAQAIYLGVAYSNNIVPRFFLHYIAENQRGHYSAYCT